VLTPVVDFLLARDDVDADKLTLYGVSQAGYWVPRALAFEHRFAAAVADGGAVDMARSWHQNIPHVLLSAYLKGDKVRFDKELELAFHLPGTHTGKITTPLYIVETDGDQFFAGQSAELAALVPGSTLARFTQEEGASYHCQPLDREITEQRMFDWMDEQIR